jgi:hypothetical protein
MDTPFSFPGGSWAKAIVEYNSDSGRRIKRREPRTGAGTKRDMLFTLGGETGWSWGIKQG